MGEVFPRVKERDPYRRLGIDSEASYEEVQDARNYLVETYRGHTAGVEAIEEAFDKIIQQKLSVRKKVKGMKAAMRKKKHEGEDYVPPFLERLRSQFARPDNQTIIRRATLFAILVRTRKQEETKVPNAGPHRAAPKRTASASHNARFYPSAPSPPHRPHPEAVSSRRRARKKRQKNTLFIFVF